MRVHYAARHVETAENGYIKCPKCNIKLHSRDLETHSCVLYPCDVCGKEFNSIDGVTHHKKRHADLGTYNCQLCEKPFKSKTDKLWSCDKVFKGIKEKNPKKTCFFA